MESLLVCNFSSHKLLCGVIRVVTLKSHEKYLGEIGKTGLSHQSSERLQPCSLFKNSFLFPATLSNNFKNRSYLAAVSVFFFFFPPQQRQQQYVSEVLSSSFCLFTLHFDSLPHIYTFIYFYILSRVFWQPDPCFIHSLPLIVTDQCAYEFLSCLENSTSSLRPLQNIKTFYS